MRLLRCLPLAKDGAQNYPQCLNLKITGAGSDVPDGTLGEKLYTDTDAGILVNFYTTISNYVIPGPALFRNLAVLKTY